MSFTDKLRMAGILAPEGFGLGPNSKSLFGNLFQGGRGGGFGQGGGGGSQMFPQGQMSPNTPMQQQPMSLPMENLRNRFSRMGIDQSQDMDTVYQPSLSELQRPALESIQLGREELGSRERIAREGMGLEGAIAGDKSDLERQKLNLEWWKSENPEGQVVIGEDGVVHLVNKKTGEIKRTGLKSGDLTEAEKIKLGLERDLTLERERQGGRVALEGERQTGREGLERLRQERPTTAREDIPTQAAQRVRNNYIELINRNPELSEWITLDPNTNMPIVAKEGAEKGWGILEDKKRFTPEDKKKILDALYAGSGMSPEGEAEGGNEVFVIGPNGEEGTVSAEDAESLPTGWRLRDGPGS